MRVDCPKWSGSRVRIVCSFTLQYVCLLVKKCQLCSQLFFVVRDIAGALSRSYNIHYDYNMPESIGDIASTLLRTTTAVLSHSPASFNYQAFLMDPLSRSPAKRSKTAEVVRIVSAVSERNLFPETQLCKLCVIPRSRALHGVCIFLDGNIFCRFSYQTNSQHTCI